MPRVTEGDGPVPIAASLCGVPIGPGDATCAYRAGTCPIHDHRERGVDRVLLTGEMRANPDIQLAIGQLRGRLFHGMPPGSDDEWKLAELIFDDQTLQELHRWRFLLDVDMCKLREDEVPPSTWKVPRLLELACPRCAGDGPATTDWRLPPQEGGARREEGEGGRDDDPYRAR